MKWNFYIPRNVRNQLCNLNVQNNDRVGSAMGALPPFGGRFPIACPRTVRASLPAYGSPLVMSVYLS